MLKISFATSPDKKTENYGLFVSKDLVLGKEGLSLDQKHGGLIGKALKTSKNFKGKEGQILSVITSGAGGTARFFVVGLGETAKIKATTLARVGASIAAALDREGVSVAAFLAEAVDGMKIAAPEMGAALAQGAQLRVYRFEKYKTKKKSDGPESRFKEAVIVLAEAEKAKNQFKALEKVNEGVFFARDLALEPANVLYPESLAKAVEELKKLGVKIQVLDEAQMKKLGMGSLLSVSKGSDRPARLVSMVWQGGGKGKGRDPVVLVGKGVTFDTGGLSLKPPANMWDMKYDMCGAAAVIGAMKGLAGRKAKAHVIGLVGLVENMPSGKATRPGDIVTSASGQTIEVQNTDAEGRLVLADLLWYAQKQFKPRCIVDLATLTGAIRTCLGQEYAGLFSNDETLADVLAKAGEEVEERLWRLPLCEGYDKKMDSTVADMKNIGGPEAASCTGAQFLQRFVDKGVAWAHLDIAGVSYDNKGHAFATSGPTAFGVRLLDRFVAAIAEK